MIPSVEFIDLRLSSLRENTMGRERESNLIKKNNGERVIS